MPIVFIHLYLLVLVLFLYFRLNEELEDDGETGLLPVNKIYKFGYLEYTNLNMTKCVRKEYIYSHTHTNIFPLMCILFTIILVSY